MLKIQQGAAREFDDGKCLSSSEDTAVIVGDQKRTEGFGRMCYESRGC